MKKKWGWSVLLGCISLWCSVAIANDKPHSVQNGTIKFLADSKLRIDSLKLMIGEHRIEAHYSFTNLAAKSIEIPIAFTVAAYSFDQQNRSQQSDFAIPPRSVDKKTIILLDEKQDITQNMGQLGWGTEDVEKFLSQYTEQTIPKEAIRNLPPIWFNVTGEPLFTLHDYYEWSTYFVEKKPDYIRHIYNPSIIFGGSSAFGQTVQERFDNKHCVSNAEIDTFEQNYEMQHYANIDYALKTGVFWKGPIPDFHLVIEKQLPSDKVFLCFDGKLVKTDDRALEFRAKNFTPKQDLNILFVRTVPKH